MRRLGILTAVIFGLLAASAQANTCTSGSSSAWSSPATWDNCGGVVPTATDTVIIDDDQVTVDVPATAASVSVVTSGALNVNTTLTVGGNVTLTSGQIAVAASLQLTAPGTFTQTGGATSITTVGGLFASGAAVSGGSVAMSGNAQLFGGLTLTGGAILTGTGTLAPGVTNTSGIITPGGAGTFGTLNTSAFAQESGGTLVVDIGAPGSGQFDKINNGSGVASLNGTLAVTRPGASMANQTFPIITSGSHTGTFSTVTGIAPDLSAVYGTGLSLVGPVVAPPPAIPNPVITLPSNKKCTSKRTIKITQNPPSGTTLTSAKITLNGKTVNAKSNGKGGFKASIKLKGLPKGKAKVKITVTTAQGKSATSTRTYKTCAKKKKK